MTDTPSSSRHNPPTLTMDELEADPHGAFRRYRPKFPFVLRADGVPIVLRVRHVCDLITDSRLRQPETEFIHLRGIHDGPLFRLFAEGMPAM